MPAVRPRTPTARIRPSSVLIIVARLWFSGAIRKSGTHLPGYRSPHEVGEEFVEVVGADFTSLRISTPVVEARANTTLHRLDHLFVFHLDPVQARPDPRFAQRRVPDVGVE